VSRRADKDFDEDFDDKEFEAESQALQRQAAIMPWILVGVFALVALILGTVAVLSTASALGAFATKATAPGKVAGFVTRTDASGQTLYSPLVDFALPDGTLQTARLSEEGLIPAYTEGQQVTVVYEKRWPENASVSHGESAPADRWIFPIISGILALAFLAATLLAVWMLRPELTGTS
jgi:hypothetical protein